MDTSSKPFRCIFCEKSFKRPDALKRHWTTCNVRRNTSYDVPQMLCKKRGKKPEACDRCARLRRACSSTQPCIACSKHRTRCTYTRVYANCGEQSLDHHHRLAYSDLFAYGNQHLASSTTWDAFTGADVLEDAEQLNQLTLVRPSAQQALPGLGTHDLLGNNAAAVCCLPGGLLFPRPTDLDIEALRTFPFLRKLASTDGLGNVFECGDLLQRSAIAGDLYCENDFYFEQLEIMQDAPQRLSPGSGGTSIDAADLISGVSAELVSKSEEIVSAIVQRTVCDQHMCQRNPSGGLWDTENAARMFFSPENLERYLSLYWSFWHPNWPVMHKPSFSISQALPALVAAMAVIGACLSTTDDDCTLASLVFDAVEDAVFNDKAFSHNHPDLQGCPGTGNLRTQLEILLAAYCVCLYQTWEGDRIAKRRVHRQRYNQVICLARDIGPFEATLRRVSTDCFAAFDWKEFALRESLARTFAYINNLDTGLAMFYQVPLRMPVSELAFDLTTPEPCFAAESAEDCYAALKVWRDTLSPHQCISLSCAVAMICSENKFAVVERMISRLSVLSMFTLISTLYKLAHQLENSLLCIALSPALKLGLKNWHRLWPSEYRDFELLDMTEAPNGLWLQRIGFQRYAPEYWLYTYLTVERAQHRSFWNQAMDSEIIQHDDTDKIRFNVLLREFESMKLASV